MSSVNPNEEGDSDTETPIIDRLPRPSIHQEYSHQRLHFPPAASTDVVDQTYDDDHPHQTSQSIYSSRLRSYNRYQEPTSNIPLSNSNPFPSSSSSYITRLPPPIGGVESPSAQYRVLNRLAARPRSGAGGSASGSRAGSGVGFEGEVSGLPPTIPLRQSATGIPLHSSIDDRFRPPSSSSVHHDPLHHSYHLPLPHTVTGGNYTPGFPSNLGPGVHQERRPSTTAGSTFGQNLPYPLSSPAQSHSGYSPVHLPPPHLPPSSSGFQTRPQSAREQLDLPRPSYGSSTSIPWDSHNQALNAQHRQSWQSTGSAGLRLSYGPRQSQPYIDVSGSSTSSTLNRYPHQPHSASISSYDYEVDHPHYHNQQLRSAGVPPSVAYPAPSTERWSIGSAYTARPYGPTGAIPRPDEGSEASFPLDFDPQRERYPTPELVYFPDVNVNVEPRELEAVPNKRRRLSATPVNENKAFYPDLHKREGFVDDWSYPTLAPVNPQSASHLSRQTSPLGTVQPFSYAYPESDVASYPSYTAQPGEDDQQRFSRLLDEEKRDIEARRRRQLAGPDSEARFRQSLKQLANDVTGGLHPAEDDGRFNTGDNNLNKAYSDIMPPKRPASDQVTSNSSQAPPLSASSTRMTRAAAAAAAQAGSQPGSVAPSMQSSRPSMSTYRYSNGGIGGNSSGMPSGSYAMNAPAVPGGAGRSTRARVYREIIGGKEQSIYGVDDETPAPLPGTTGGQQKRKASSNAGSLRSTATYNGALGGNGLSTNGYHQQQPQGNGKRRKPDDGYGYYQTWDDRASAIGSVRTNGKAGTGGSTATQSTAHTGIGFNAADQHVLPPSAGHYGSHYVPNTRNDYYPASAKSYNSTRPQIMPPSRPAYHQPQYAIPAELPAPRLAQAQPQQILQAPSQSSQGTDPGPAPCDDKDGHYIVTPGSYFGPQQKFRIIRLLGQGTFGKVVEATEKNKPMTKVAVKIIRAVPKYREAAGIEIRVLRALRDNDPENKHKCIHLLDTFDWRNHICLVTPLYGQSVFDFLKENKFQPFPEKHIQSFAASLLDSLKFLHRLNLIHTDLKPENILLVSNAYYSTGERRANAKSKHILRDTEIRLIDFGSATFDNEFHSSVVSTRHYRAPEIILGLGWSFPCDLFSVGCILVEFYTGDALFQTHDNLEHLAMMEVVMGKMPLTIANRACKTKGEFFKGNKLDYPNSQTTKHSKKFVKAMKPLSEIIKVDHRMTDITNNFRMQFLDLVTRLLHFDPQRRMTVSTAMVHAFFKTPAPPPPPPPKNPITNAPSLGSQR